MQLLESNSKSEQLRILKEHADVTKKQYESQLREKEKVLIISVEPQLKQYSFQKPIIVQRGRPLYAINFT